MFFFLKHGVRKKQTAENNYSNIDNNNVQVHSRSPISIAIHARTRHRLLLVNDSDMYHTLLCVQVIVDQLSNFLGRQGVPLLECRTFPTPNLQHVAHFPTLGLFDQHVLNLGSQKYTFLPSYWPVLFTFWVDRQTHTHTHKHPCTDRRLYKQYLLACIRQPHQLVATASLGPGFSAECSDTSMFPSLRW